MTARLRTLGNDGIHAARLEPTCFCHRCCRSEDEATDTLDRINELLIRQAEVKTHNLRAQLHDKIAHVCVEWSAISSCVRAWPKSFCSHARAILIKYPKPYSLSLSISH
jgi:hypothetical protein